MSRGGTPEEAIGILDLINKGKRRLNRITDIKEKVGMPSVKITGHFSC